MPSTRSFAALLLAASAVLAAPDAARDGRRWWSDVRHLASDKMRGRGTGTPGYLAAARFVSSRFAALHLTPAGSSGFYQSVPFQIRRIDESHSSLALVRGGSAQPLTLGPDAVITLAGDPAPEIEAPAVFAGYALQVPEAHIDDFDALDVRGKIVVYLQGAPRGLAGPLAAHSQSLARRWEPLHAAGAAGLAVIPNPSSSDIPWPRSSLARLLPHLFLDDPALGPAPGLRLSLRINPAFAPALFEGAPHSFSELLSLARNGASLPRFPLPVSFRARVAYTQGSASSPNVAAVLPGSDPVLKNQYVVLSAHLDHLGVGPAINGDTIYNGAMDNASGIATLLETARLLRQSHAQPKRSLLILAVCGEEHGELGSQYFAAHPTVPPASLVADINLDMFLPLYPLKALEVQGLDESTLGAQVRAAGASLGIGVLADQQPALNRFIRSDQYSFIKHGIPALAFKFSAPPGSPEFDIQKRWLTTRYHAPSDDLSQPVDLAAAARFNGFILSLLQDVADAPEAPRWNPDSFFRRFALPPTPRTTQQGAGVEP